MTLPEIRERLSPNHGSRGEPPNIRAIDMLVLHYTGMQSAAEAIDRLCDPEARVSSHYVVEEDGAIWRLVPEERRPELCVELMVVLCERLRRTNEQVEDFAFLDLEARIAKVLLRLTHDEASQSPASRLGLKISQRALGELVGGSRESVNKHLQDWKRSGIIEIEKGSILIRDLEALTELA